MFCPCFRFLVQLLILSIWVLCCYHWQLWLASAMRNLGLYWIQYTIYIVISANSSKSCRYVKCARMPRRTLWSEIFFKKMVPHFFGFICLVLEVLFLRTGKGRKLETDPPTLESLSTKSVQRMRRHKTTVPHCNAVLWRRRAQRDRTSEREVSKRLERGLVETVRVD